MAKPRIELIARGVLYHGDALLVCRNRKHGHCFLPGGHIDFGETAREALQRELMEEAGVSLLAADFLGALEATFEQPHAKGPERHHELNLVFQLTPTDGTPPLESLTSQEEHIELFWARPDQLRGVDPEIVLLPQPILQVLRQQQGSPVWLTHCE